MMDNTELLKLLEELDKEFGYYEELESEPFIPSHTMIELAKELHEEHVQGWV